MKFENQYLTYREYYKLGGKISEASFNLLEFRAEKKIDEMSSNRFRESGKCPKELKLCVYELIDVFDKENNSGVVSEKVGDYNVTRETKKELNKAKENIIKQYLSEVIIDGVNALYCGFDDEYKPYLIS